MNIEHLRKSLKVQWLTYYREHRDWISRLGVWVDCEGQRRPSSSFILATLTTLEPQFTQILPFIVELSGNPDRIVMALGLNFNPDEQLEALAKAEEPPSGEARKMLPGGANSVNLAKTVVKPTQLDQACEGVRDSVTPGVR